jgi:16S rRNA (uracil1498-N3)-methyltransferase
MTIRIFHERGLAVDERATLSADESHYAARVRRAAIGDELVLLDGRALHRVVVEAIGERCEVRCVEVVATAQPEPLELWLGVPDPTAVLASITAACELGATRIVLVRCRFSPTALPSDTRIEKVVRAAQRQCGRPVAPAIEGPVALSDALASSAAPLGAFAWEQLRGPASELGPDTGRRLLVGPEGGLADDEAQACRARGMLAISLGPWTLRTETAVAAGLARLQATARARPGATSLF